MTLPDISEHNTKLNEINKDREQKILSLKAKLINKPQEFVQERLNKINNSLNKRKFKDAKPKHKGNITMYQHLSNLKKELEDNPTLIINKELQKVENEIFSINEEKKIIEAKDGISRNK